MKIKCPQGAKAIHRRKPVKEIPCYCGTSSGIVLRWEDAEGIYFAAQKMFDRLDVTQEIENWMEERSLSKAEGRAMLRRAGEIADTYRAWLDNDPHQDHVLCIVLNNEYATRR